MEEFVKKCEDEKKERLEKERLARGEGEKRKSKEVRLQVQKK